MVNNRVNVKTLSRYIDVLFRFDNGDCQQCSAIESRHGELLGSCERTHEAAMLKWYWEINCRTTPSDNGLINQADVASQDLVWNFRDDSESEGKT
ncbi:MAG: hypothetical protein ACYCWE_22200 [Eubacteriales bacterium]